jgi:hypothetical protein
MTDDTLPTRQSLAAKDRSGKLTVTGKLKVALDAMLYEGSRRADAAKAAGMTDHGLREAFKKPHVKAYYNAGLVVLRESERARNIKRLTEIRDKADNMPAVQAIKALEGLGDDLPVGLGDPRQQQPGISIRIIHQAPAPPMIDVTPIRPPPRQIEDDDERNPIFRAPEPR